MAKQKQTELTGKETNVTEATTENEASNNRNEKAVDNIKTENQRNVGQANVVDNEAVRQEVEFFTLAEAYEVMLKGGVFRFKEWDKNKVPYVAFVPRGQTTIVIAKSVDSNNKIVFRPSQAEAVKKLWYRVK
jgi:hypothetical protein